MEISFMVSKTGTRILPKPKPQSRSALEDNDKVDVPPQLHQIQSPSTRKRSVDDTEHVAGILDAEEVSFILNIFPDGYTIKNPSEGNLSHQNTAQNDPNLLCPYNKTSESLFAAIDCGRLPADFLDDIHFKYSNGAVVCEVRDYRRDSCEQGVNGLFTVSSPSITKISLKMSLDNVVKDIDQFSDNAWTYGDTMEAESRVLKDPTPNLTRLCNSLKLNLNISGIRRKRLRQIYGAVTVSDNNLEKVINTQQDAVNCMSKIPSSVGNIIGSLTFSTHVGKEIDKRILERFSRIQMWTERLQLNRKKYKIDKYKKTRGFTLPTQHLAHFFHSNDVTFKDETRSLLYQQQQFSIIGSNHLKLNIQQQEVEILQKQQEGENQRKMVMMEMEMEMGQQSKTNVTQGQYGNISDVLMMDYGGTMDSFSALNLG